MPIFYTDSGSFNILEVTGSTILSGSLIISGTSQFAAGGLSGSLFGTASWADSSSVSISSSYVAPTGLPIGVVSSSLQISTGSFTGSFIGFHTGSYTGSFTGSLLGSASFSTTASAATSITFTPNTASFASTASFVNTLTTLTASNIQLNSLTDTTAANKVLVLDTATNKIFTTASVGTGGGGSGTGFPFSGSGVITGSLLISSSATGLALTVTGSTILTGSGLIFQVSGSASIRDNFTVNGNTLFVNAGQNRVGIGTGRPSVTLEVSGDTIITGSLLVSGSGLVVSGATQLFGPLRVANQTAVNTSMSVVVGNVPGYIQFNATPDIVYYDFSNAQVVTNAGMISPGDIVSRGNIKNDGGKDVKITGGTAGVTSITSSLSVEGAGATNTTVYGNNTINDFSQIINQNLSNGVNASTDFVLAKDDATDFQEFVDFGINSTGFVGLIGNANDAYLYVTSSTGELVIGNASGGPKGNIRLFTSGGDTDNVTRVFISSSGNVGIGITSGLQSRLTVSGSVSASSYTSSFNNAVGYFGTSSWAQSSSVSISSSFASTSSFVNPLTTVTASNLQVTTALRAPSMTGSVFSGSFFNILEMSMATSGTIVLNGTQAISLDLNQANYFQVSASVAGTVTWTVVNPPPTGRMQTFAIEYTNGGIKTNTWFTNTRWPAGVAPTLTSASANPDLLSFTTDDAGANWRGVLLQRASA